MHTAQASRRRRWSLARIMSLASKALPHTLLIALSLLGFYPFLWAFFATFKRYRELMTSLSLLPRVWTLANWQEVLAIRNLWTGSANTIFISVTCVTAVLLTSSAVAYVFAKYRFPFKERLFTALLATMMVPGAVTMVPMYITLAQLRLLDRLAGLIITSLWSTFGIFLLRQFMETIPNDLVDAARIDGASEPYIYARLIVPMCSSPLAALALFSFLGHWDAYVWPAVVLNSVEKRTLALHLRSVASLYYTRYDITVTAAMFTIFPIAVLYAFVSKYMIRGMAMSGLKF